MVLKKFNKYLQGHGKSIPEFNVFYLINLLFSGILEVEIISGDLSYGFEVDILINYKGIRIAIEYDGSGWHKDIFKDIDKNNNLFEIKIPLIRVRERYCPVMKNKPGLFIINRITRNNSVKIIHEEIFKLMPQISDIIINFYETNNKMSSEDLFLLKINREKIREIEDFEEHDELIYEIANEELKLMLAKKIERMNKLIDLAKNHFKYFTTVTIWNEYATLNGLQKAHFYISNFESWENALLKVHGTNSKGLRQEAAISQGKSHPHLLTSYEFYKSFTKGKRDLISAGAIRDLFGSWNEFKYQVGIDIIKPTKGSYSSCRHADDYLYKIVFRFPFYFVSSKKWDNFAKLKNKEHNEIIIPSSSTYSRRFGTFEIARQEILGYGRKVLYRKILNEIAHTHSIEFTTQKKWDEYSSINNLPNSKTYAYFFGGGMVQSKK